MLYNRSTGIYKFGNNTYPQRIRHRSNLGHIFRGKKVSYGPENTVNVGIVLKCILSGMGNHGLIHLAKDMDK